MWSITFAGFVFLLITTNVLCEIPFDLRKDFFNIYKGVAIQTKAVTNATVTRDQVIFHAYRNKPEPKSVILNDTNLDLLKGTKGHVVFIAHGWTDSAYSEWVMNLKDAFLKTYPNDVVIGVDWKEPANQPYYVSSINVFDIGNLIADMVVQLVDKHKIAMSQIILVGHSLGGQSVGFAGKKLKKLGKTLHRIVALDPAGPLFDVRPDDKRLNPTDAEVVHVIHSDGGSFGFKEACGTIDFYPNGGDFQPGCTRVDILDFKTVKDPVVCDHERSYRYFIEAVQHPVNYLVAKECSEWSYLRKTCNETSTVSMGDLTTTKTGKYYLETNRESPYNKKIDKAATGLFDRMSKASTSFNEQVASSWNSLTKNLHV